MSAGDGARARDGARGGACVRAAVPAALQRQYSPAGLATRRRRAGAARTPSPFRFWCGFERGPDHPNSDQRSDAQIRE